MAEAPDRNDPRSQQTASRDDSRNAARDDGPARRDDEPGHGSRGDAYPGGGQRARGGVPYGGYGSASYGGSQYGDRFAGSYGGPRDASYVGAPGPRRSGSEAGLYGEREDRRDPASPDRQSGREGRRSGYEAGRYDETGRDERRYEHAREAPHARIATTAAGGREREQHEHDQHYARWRDEQMKALDDDYRRWRDERYQRFCTEFDAWRRERGRAAARRAPNAAGDASEARPDAAQNRHGAAQDDSGPMH